jgi:hypothetical protein
VGDAWAFPRSLADGGGGLNHWPRYGFERSGSRPEFNRGAELRPVGEQDTEVRLGFWPHEGITVDRRGEARGKRLSLALEMPFLALAPRFGTVVAGDALIYEYAPFAYFALSPGPLRHQVVVLDLHSLTLGVLADGRCPVVVLDEPPRGTVPWEPSVEQPRQRTRRNWPR